MVYAGHMRPGGGQGRLFSWTWFVPLHFPILAANFSIMTSHQVRVRFAPSPTGPLHIGGVRTALFNYLFAMKHNGSFILRIEDTDRTRYVKGAEDYIMKSLEWCGIKIDEGIREGGAFGPYRQSDRREIYQQYAQKLLETGFAYEAFDSPGELEDLRLKQESEGKTFTYDARIRKQLKNSVVLEPAEINELRQKGIPSVIRFRIPENQEVGFFDIVRDRINVNTDTLDDKVLMKADGMPTYHLANVVDDHLMEISHVIRGEEWLPSTPLHVLLYRAFGWEDSMPEFAHMPLTLKPDGKGKLSKRDGDRLGFPVFPLEWVNDKNEVSSGYRESGYLPEAFINILAFLGWNPGTDKELYTMDELIEAFSLERITRAGSRFDPEKAKWYNHQYIIRKSNQELAEWLQHKLPEEKSDIDLQYIARIIALIKERAFLLDDLWNESRLFFVAPVDYDEKIVGKVWKEDTSALIRDMRSMLESQEDFSPTALESLIKDYSETNGIGLGKVLNPLRLLMVGTNAGPGMLDIISILGREETLSRIDRGLAALSFV